jgi:ketosteroid isomerase-like protein
VPGDHAASGAPADPEATARAYYAAIDDGRYGDLRALLAPGFRHVRPDRTLDGPDRFVRFMRDERPATDTTHRIDGVYRGAVGVAVSGDLLRPDGAIWFAFVDAFETRSGDGRTRIASLRTYTR